ncbi:hypothetical protein GQ42DRAFT_82375 [Ramicandelaber brevisporus]|nr:hypothetical protein GQ42DRAFT_82375 [Ramicandelaber brevisporus]
MLRVLSHATLAWFDSSCFSLYLFFMLQLQWSFLFSCFFQSLPDSLFKPLPATLSASWPIVPACHWIGALALLGPMLSLKSKLEQIGLLFRTLFDCKHLPHTVQLQPLQPLPLPPPRRSSVFLSLFLSFSLFLLKDASADAAS